jgi:hypothetical protein
MVEFVSKFATWAESTPASASGRRLGRYHVLLKPHDLDLKSAAGMVLEQQ